MTGASKKFKTHTRPLFMPRSVPTCQQYPDLSSGLVPLMVNFDVKTRNLTYCM